MSHPYKDQAASSGKTKMSALGGKNTGIDASRGTSGMQKILAKGNNRDNESSIGEMKRGGRLDKKARSSKPKPKMVIDDAAPMGAPPGASVPAQAMPDPLSAPNPGLGAGAPPVAPPMMQKRGGKVGKFAKGGRVDLDTVHKSKNPTDSTLSQKQQATAMKKATGGAVRGSFPKKMEEGAGSGLGRLEKAGK